MGLRAVHDLLLASRPQGAIHDETTCPFCLTPGGAEPCGCGSTGAADVAALRAEVADLHRQLDAQMVLAGRAAAESADALATAAERAELQDRMAERARAAMAVGLQPAAVAEYLERWSELADDDFDLLIDGFAAMSSAPGDKIGVMSSAPGDKIPAHTALWASRDTVTETASPVHELLELRQLGHKIDFSQLH
jgi:hypothetical protein